MNYKFQELPKPPSVLICWKGLQNSLEAIIFMVTVYNRKNIQIEISQQKKCIGQNPGEVPNTELSLFGLCRVKMRYFISLGVAMCAEYWKPGKLKPELCCSKSLLELNHVGMIN